MFQHFQARPAAASSKDTKTLFFLHNEHDAFYDRHNVYDFMITMMMMMMMMKYVPGTENNLQELPPETMAPMVFADGLR